jgi:hypothetical protein
MANADNQFIFSVNFEEAPALTGAYQVEGCEGTSPVLEIMRGVEYEFVQHEMTNWMHPIGMAYYPDGALGYDQYAEVPELENPTPEDCALPEFACEPGAAQAPLYGADGVFESLDDWNNGDEGLDFYEPYFQRPLDQWMEKKFSVKITIPEDSKTKEFFYFCHIHKGMSGLIVVSDPAPDANELAIPFDPETYYVPKDAFDEACGTSGLSQFGTEYSEFCPDMEFVCVGDASSQYTECLEAVNCQMNYEMRVPVVSDSGEGVLVNFMHEMIPHHVNAVNMARFAMKFADDTPGYTDEDFDIPGMLLAIINSQNAQIQNMQNWLATYYPEPADPTSACEPTLKK